MHELGYKNLKGWLESEGKRKTFGVTPQTWVLNTLIRSIDISREEMIPPDKISSCETFTEAVCRYDAKLHERRYLDFSSMMSLTVQYLESDKQFRDAVRGRFTYITVDEYQDVNPIQERLINLMTGPKNNLCVVGDDDQSIYQWRGSTVENILTFKERYKNIFTHHLPTNYRSSDNIIKLSNSFIKKNLRRLSKEMKPSDKKAEKGDVYKIDFQEQRDEIAFM